MTYCSNLDHLVAAIGGKVSLPSMTELRSMQELDWEIRKSRWLTTDEWLQELLNSLIELDDTKEPLKKHFLRTWTTLILFSKSTLTKAVRLMELPSELQELPRNQEALGEQP